jgi:hypothetical protein
VEHALDTAVGAFSPLADGPYRDVPGLRVEVDQLREKVGAITNQSISHQQGRIFDAFSSGERILALLAGSQPRAQ